MKIFIIDKREEDRLEVRSGREREKRWKGGRAKWENEGGWWREGEEKGKKKMVKKIGAKFAHVKKTN